MSIAQLWGEYPVRPVPFTSPESADFPAMREYVRDLRIAKRSEVTISHRVELLERLRSFLADREIALIEATTDDLRDFQATFAHRQPATVDLYTRHMQALFRWATER